MSKLITGGTGYVGSETARQLVQRGEEVVIFDININRYRIADVEDKVKIVRGDLSVFSEVLNVVKENKVDAIYHMGSLLAYQSNQNPWASININVMGTYHVLEAARLFDVPKMMMTSSRGTFGLGIGDVVDDWTIQRPIVFYGWGKLYSEGMGRWYSENMGVDFRSIRYPLVIVPNDRTPGHDVPPMIEDAIRHKPHVSLYGSPDAPGSPWVYVTDAAKAAIDVLDAPKEKIQTVNYNVAGTPATVPPSELVPLLEKRYPGFSVTYKADANAAPKPKTAVFSDKYAREEWGWRPQFDSVEAIVAQFEKDIKEHPDRYDFKM